MGEGAQKGCLWVIGWLAVIVAALFIIAYLQQNGLPFTPPTKIEIPH